MGIASELLVDSWDGGCVLKQLDLLTPYPPPLNSYFRMYHLKYVLFFIYGS